MSGFLAVLMQIGIWIASHPQQVLSAVVAFLMGCIAIALLIPGDQPEKFLQSCVDFLEKFSRK